MIEEADYVVCGGGSAGCVMAARLSEDPDKRVVLLEIGDANDRLLVDVPAGLQMVVANQETNWMYFTEPDATQNDRRVFWSAGRGLGGGSAINGMVYIRGTTYDYDHWSKELGCTGWSWDEVLPYFKKSEDFDGEDGPSHGKGGPLGVSQLRAMHPLAYSFMDACKEVGMGEVEDYCAGDIDGTFVNHATQRNGKRCSAAEGFLKPAMSRPNLQVITGAMVDKILFESNRAVGVRFTYNGKSRDIRVNGEVILSSGTIQTPPLLMRSGVGPGAHLQERGIDVVAAREQVGKNLHEHPSLPNSRLVYEPTYNVRNNPLILAREGLKYLFTRRGWLATAAVHAMAHVRSDPDLQYPDIKYQMLPFWADANAKGYFGADNPVPDSAKNFGITIGVNLMTPNSRGQILLQDTDPASRPMIDYRIYEDPADLERMRKGLKFANTIFEAPALAPHIKATAFPPDPHQSDEEWDNQLRACSATGLHPVGTCRMGNDPEAVVDTQLRVNGVDGVRIADCSIIPLLPSANTNAPAIMIGERCADFVHGNRR
ncbi:MAG: GMC family oxidoreductase N-terminal domain-containing protein [Novosphingobium sp.]|nr:GMC family oxidoreductase N-terminal domain-containing protein [Novosphingobium sp.]